MALLSFSSVTINRERNGELLTSQSNTKQCARVANATVKHETVRTGQKRNNQTLYRMHESLTLKHET